MQGTLMGKNRSWGTTAGAGVGGGMACPRVLPFCFLLGSVRGHTLHLNVTGLFSCTCGLSICFSPSTKQAPFPSHFIPSFFSATFCHLPCGQLRSGVVRDLWKQIPRAGVPPKPIHSHLCDLGQPFTSLGFSFPIYEMMIKQKMLLQFFFLSFFLVELDLANTQNTQNNA